MFHLLVSPGSEKLQLDLIVGKIGFYSINYVFVECLKNPDKISNYISILLYNCTIIIT